MIDTTRIHYLLPIPRLAQVVHYTQPDDLAFIQQWITYLRTHARIPASVRTTVLDTDSSDPGAAPRLVVNVRDGHSDRGDILRLGQSLLHQRGQLTVVDADTLHHSSGNYPTRSRRLQQRRPLRDHDSHSECHGHVPWSVLLTHPSKRPARHQGRHVRSDAPVRAARRLA